MSYLLRSFVIAVCLQLQLASVNGEGFVPTIPGKCQSQGYCDEPIPEYPEEHVEKIIEKGTLGNSPGVVDVTKQTRRQDPSEEKLCADAERQIIPKVAQDVNGQWNYILNTKKYQQAFLVRICTNANSKCSPVIHVNTGYTASCQQQFITQVLVALDGQGGTVQKNFNIPSNCYCKVNSS